MLGTTLWFLIAIGLFGTLLLDVAAAFGRAAIHAAADHALEAAIHDAVADYQNQLRSSHGTAPPAFRRSYDTGMGEKQFVLAYEVEPTTVAAPRCASGETSAPDTVAWLQCNRFVNESRVSLHVYAAVRDSAGAAVLAQRHQFVTLRLFGEPPYSALVGRKDSAAQDPASADALAVPAHEGDAGGDTVSGVAPSPPASPWPAGGTLIHVRYECHDGAGSCTNAAPPDPDADLQAGVRWQNGNRPSP